ncbi:MAG: hypothetical protein N4A41_08905 [Crocinitomicaceae bacterium]|jgi:hypothetical protein|nr:hypothetical protein [Crocinitomicaceae bacterium]
MKILLIIPLLYSFYTFGQGGWDIGYVDIDSVGNEYIGQDVKIDFLKAPETQSVNPLEIRKIISNEDSAFIEINGKKIQLKERRNIYDDWGFYDEQYLECVHFGTTETLRIYHTVIEEISAEGLKVRFYFEISSSGNQQSQPRRRCESIWIEKSKLNGILIKT